MAIRRFTHFIDGKETAPAKGHYLASDDPATGEPWAEVALGLLVVLGLFRKYTLIASALILVGGAFPIWRHFLDPFGRYLFANPDDANILFFPSLTVAGAALALIALRDLDTLALDRLFGKKDG